MKIPAFVHLILDIVFWPCFVEGEPVHIKLRKIGILIISFMASCSMFGIPAIILLRYNDPYDHGWTAFRIVMLVLMFYIFFHFVVFHYCFIRFTRTAPDWFADQAAIGLGLSQIQLSIATPHNDMRCLLLILTMLVILFSPPKLPFHLFFYSLVYLFGLFRDQWQDMMPFLEFSFDEPMGTLFEHIAMVVIVTAPVFCGVGGLTYIVRSYVKGIEAQSRARAMTLEVAKSLALYDIDAVQKTIADNEGVVDEELLKSFLAIKDNLKEFRPHIPQYLIEAAVERSRREREVHDSDSEGDVTSAASSSKKSGITRERRETFRSNASNTSKSSRSSRSSRASSNGKEALRPNVVHRSITSKDAHIGSITSAFMDLGVKSITSGFAQLATAIDKINEAASATKTSIHSIQGDAIFSSWNATSRSANHSVHGCTFADKLRDVLAEFTSLTVSGSVVRCNCYTIFAGTKQSHFLLMGEGLERHKKQRDLAAQLGTIVVNQAAVAQSETWGFFAGFGTDESGGILYDLVRPRPHTDDEEWMYALDAEENPWDVVTTAAKAMNQEGSDRTAVKKQLEEGLTDELRGRESVQFLLHSLSH